jgi:Baseplate J-like protein.
VASLDDLLVPRDRDTLTAILLAYLQGEGFPVTDYNAGGVALTILQAVTTGLLDRENLIRYLVSGGFLDLAAALTDANGNPVEDWCEMLADQQFNCQRAPATFTQKNLTLTCATGSGPVTRAAGQLRAVSQAGNYYVNTTSLTVPNGSTTTAIFQAETSGPINDATGTIDTLSTPVSGVTVLDDLASYSVPVDNIAGSGSITPSASGTTNPASSWLVQITQSGNLGGPNPAYYTITEYKSDGTHTTSAADVISSTLTLASIDSAIDLTLTFANGGSGVAFLAGDTYYINTPGPATVQMGSTEETLSALVQRCRDRWPALSAIPTEGRYAAWARQCSTDQHLGINRIRTAPSELVHGLVYVYLADYSGAPSAETLAIIQLYFDARQTDTDRATAAAASAVVVAPSGNVWCRKGKTGIVQAAAIAAWNAYLASIPIGGETAISLTYGNSGVVRCSKLEEILMDAGAYEASGLQLNSSGIDVDLQITAAQVPTSSTLGLLDPAMVWAEVG